MFSIRKSVFETNSSSTHSITICNENDYEKWLNGEVWLNNFSSYVKRTYNCFSPFVNRDKALELYKIIVNEDDTAFKEAKKSQTLLSFVDEEFEGDLVSIEEYNRHVADFEEFEKKYTTENGETVVAFGYYGSDY